MTTTSNVLHTTGIQGDHDADTCSPISQMRSSLGFGGGRRFHLEFLFMEKLRGITESGEEHTTDFLGINYR